MGERRAVASTASALLVLITSVGVSFAAATPPTGPPAHPIAGSGQADRARWQSRRNTPEARADRRASRSAFRDQSRAEAVSLARRRFPQLFDSPPWRPFVLREGEHVDRYVDDHTVLIDQPGSQSDTVAVSSLPTRVLGGDGSKTPVSLALRDVGDAFAPSNPLVPLRVPKVLGSVRVGADLSVRPSGSAVSAVETDGEDEVLYPNAVTDGDAAVVVHPMGAEVLWHLRSADSPEVLDLLVNPGDNDEVRPAAGDPSRIEIVRGGTVIGAVSPPQAFDSDGAEVPVTTSFESNRVTYRVAHRDGDFRYPIVLDPLITDVGSYVEKDDFDPFTAQGAAGWISAQSGQTFGFNEWGLLSVATNGSLFYPNGAAGQWQYSAALTGTAPDQLPRDTFVYKVDFHDVYNQPANTTLGMGIVLANGTPEPNQRYWGWVPHESQYGEPGPRPIWYTAAGYFGEHCITWECDPSKGTTASNRNLAVFQLGIDGDGGNRYANARFGGATVYLNDLNWPVYDTVAHTGVPPGWADSATPYVDVRAHDDGFGMKQINVVDLGNEQQVGPALQSTCIGDRVTRCYKSMPSTSGTSRIQYSLAGLTEGTHQLVLHAQDAIHRGARTSPWTVKVDRTAPSIDTPTGSIYRNGTWVKEGIYDFDTFAHDPYSGVHTLVESMAPALTGRDLFSRVTANGWGTANTGGPWTVRVGTSVNFATSGSEGQITAPPNTPQTIGLGDQQMVDSDTNVDVRFPSSVQPTGDVRAEIMSRRSPTEAYRAVLFRDAAGKIWVRLEGTTSPVGPSVDTGMTYTSGDVYRLRARVSGVNPTSLYAKVWRSGSPEPGTWTTTATDSTSGPQVAGEPALRLLQATPGNVTTGFDNFTVSALGSRDRMLAQSPKRDAQGNPVTPPVICDTTGCDHDLHLHGGWDTNGELEGQHTFYVKSRDPLSHWATERSWTLKLDRSVPDVTVSGDFQQSANKRLVGDQYSVQVDARDVSSGVASIELLINGSRRDSSHLKTQSGPCDGCGLPASFTVRSDQLKMGSNQVTVRTTDFAGNVKNVDWQVWYQPGIGDRPYATFNDYTVGASTTARVDVASGNLLVVAADLQDVDLDVSRYYNSLTAGSSRTFGFGWTASVGSDVRLQELSDGSVDFFAPSGYVLRFQRTAQGTYDPPPLFLGSLKRQTDSTYVVTVQSSGDEFHFPSLSGKLTAVTNGGGQEVAQTYAGDGTLTGIGDEEERTVGLTWQGGRIATTRDPDGVSNTYRYDAAGNLVESNTSQGRVTYTYDGGHRLTEIAAASGERATFAYESAASGRVSRVTRYSGTGDPVGSTTTYNYGSGTTTAVGSAGAVVYQWDPNLQVYSPDQNAPIIYQPFGYDTDDGAGGEYVAGSGAATVDVEVLDPGAGLRRIWLEQVGGPVLVDRSPTCNVIPDQATLRVCPPEFHEDFSVSTAGLSEGAHQYRLNATDDRSNTAQSDVFSLLVDRTAPPQLQSVDIQDFDGATSTTTIGFSGSGEDPELPTGEPGSGLSTIRYRFRVGSGSFSAWSDLPTDSESADLPNTPTGSTIVVEARPVDAVGNAGAILSQTLTAGAPPAETPEEYGTLPSGTATIEVVESLTIHGSTPADDYTLPGASAQIALEDANGNRAVRLTDQTGMARFANIAPGTYRYYSLNDDPATPHSTTASGGSTKREDHGSELEKSDYEATPEEKSICIALESIGSGFCGVYMEDRKKATTFAAANYTEPQAGSEGTKANAFKHVVWVAMMYRSTVIEPLRDHVDLQTVLDLARAHESKSRHGMLKDRRETRQDFHNNWVGFKMGKLHEPYKGRYENDEALCNHARAATYIRGHLHHFRRGTTEWRKFPAAKEVVWHRRLHKTTHHVVHMVFPTQCGN